MVLQLVLLDLHRSGYVSASGKVLLIPMFFYVSICLLIHLCGLVWQLLVRCFLVRNMEQDLCGCALLYNSTQLAMYSMACASLCYVGELTDGLTDKRTFVCLMSITMSLAVARVLVNLVAREHALI